MTRKKSNPHTLPDTCVLEITGTSKFGDYTAAVVEALDNPQKLPIYVSENRRIKPALAVGDKFIGRLSLKKDSIIAKPITRVGNPDEPDEIIYGLIEKKDGKYYLRPSEKNNYMVYLLDNTGKVQEGDFVKVALTASGRRFKQAHIAKNFGAFDLNKATASLVLEKYDIPYEFSASTLKESQNLPSYCKSERENLTSLPLVTIDGADSKDFDDAVYAKKLENGFQLIVAIADVAFYVRHGSAVDKDAYQRGNSVYLPNMVVPMLPETLCNDLCSLRPKEERAAMACFMDIDNEGNIKNFDFKRAIIKSAARLTYEEVHDALQGKKSANIIPVFTKVIKPIYEAYQALAKARDKRGALNLETDEFKIKIDSQGRVIDVEKEQHFISHQIVEEFMIAANICAAKILGKSKLPTMYRIHDKPQEEKLKEIEPLLHNLGLKLPDINALQPGHFNKILELCSSGGYNAGIGELILRLQCQAKYAPQNIGHFGLGLTDYAHFTSPIRRYADLLIHRALIKAYHMPDGGELEEEATLKIFEEIGEHLCVTERKAVNAERDLIARFISAYLAPSVGCDFEVKISGISTAGLFVRLNKIGAEGLIPMSSLPVDNYLLEAGNMELRGESYGLHFKFGDALNVKLLEASPITGGLIFKYIDPEEGVKYIEKGGKPRGGFKKVAALKKAQRRLPEEQGKQEQFIERIPILEEEPLKQNNGREKLPKKARKEILKENNKKKSKKKSNAK